VRKTYYIIVVEEDEVVFEKIVRALEKLGCQHDIRRVSTQEGLEEELIRLAPDFVICDHSRAEWNGFAILEQVRAFEPTMPVAVIGGLDKSAHATLLASGVDACLDRDHLGELAPTLRQILNRRAAQQWEHVTAIRQNIRRFAGNCFLQARAG
jgi:CheY-like chemotaxis protein